EETIAFGPDRGRSGGGRAVARDSEVHKDQGDV
ncbi:MAG: hypothetical protein AVDCRST_MAG05-966, partial [uncultured Rubrobacteraceae bacterium]